MHILTVSVREGTIAGECQIYMNIQGSFDIHYHKFGCGSVCHFDVVTFHRTYEKIFFFKVWKQLQRVPDFIVRTRVS